VTRTIFRQKLSFLKLDAATFAEQIRVGKARVESWRNGTRRVPVVVERLIDSMCRLQRVETKKKRRARR
jgi:hypothetical protein